MATKRSAKGAASKEALSSDDGVTLPRLSLQETGFVGLKSVNGNILQEQQRVFRYPHFLKVVEELRANPTVSASMSVYRFMISRKKWRVTAKDDFSDITKQRASLVETMMHDMEDGFDSFISSVVPFLEYGFSIHEIVPYRRLYRNKSKYNDGIVGIKKLAIRNQDTISRWVFTEDGRDLVRVEQSLTNLENSYRYSSLLNKDGLLELPREKFLLFTAGATAGNPQGNSIYKTVYLAHKQLQLLQENELQTIAKDSRGLLRIGVPAAYLQGESSPDGGATAEAFKTTINSFNNGTCGGLLVPVEGDPETKLARFEYEIMSSRGTASVDVESVIKRLQSDILVALQTDVLALGANGSGSFALADQKTSILGLSVDSRLKEIQDVLNRQLIPYIYKVNGWSQEELPEFVYEDEEDFDIETFSAAIQRIAAVGLVEVDRNLLNKIRRVIGVQEKAADEPVNKDELSSNMSNTQSRSGDSMTVGKSGQGTADIGGDSDKSDKSVANKSNK